MVNQEQPSKHPEPPRSQAGTMSGGIEGILHRLVLLAELQAELFRSDVRRGLRRLVFSCILVGCAAGMSVACLCVVLLSIAELLASAGGLQRSAAFLIAAMIGVAISVGLALAAGLRFRAVGQAFEQTRDEWGRTVDWLERTLTNVCSKDALPRPLNRKPMCDLTR